MKTHKYLVYVDDYYRLTERELRNWSAHIKTLAAKHCPNSSVRVLGSRVANGAFLAEIDLAGWEYLRFRRVLRKNFKNHAMVGKLPGE